MVSSEGGRKNYYLLPDWDGTHSSKDDLPKLILMSKMSLLRATSGSVDEQGQLHFLEVSTPPHATSA